VPTGKQMVAVTVNGQPYANFNPHTETIDLSQLTGTLEIQVTYHDTPQR
jgi:hypothetical protein